MRRIKSLFVITAGAYIGFVLLLIYLLVPVGIVIAVPYLILMSINPTLATSMSIAVTSYTFWIVKFLVFSTLSGSIALLIIKNVAENQYRRSHKIRNRHQPIIN